MVKNFFENITPQQQEQFAMLTPLYEDWNSKINVVPSLPRWERCSSLVQR